MIILDTKVSSQIGVGGLLGGPLYVVVDVSRLAADILNGVAAFLHSMASILSNVPDIFKFACPTPSVLWFSMGKIHFFPKVLKNWSS